MTSSILHRTMLGIVRRNIVRVTALSTSVQILVCRRAPCRRRSNDIVFGSNKSIKVFLQDAHPGVRQNAREKLQQTQDDNYILAYWLSNASTFLLLLQHTLKASSTAGTASQCRRSSSSATAFSRMAQSFHGVPHGLGLSFVSNGLINGNDSLHQVEAKYPALLFKQQLIGYVEKIYGTIRDNLKKEISPLLVLCIQAPRTSRAILVNGTSNSVASSAAQQALIAHWRGIVRVIGNFLSMFKENHVTHNNGAMVLICLKTQVEIVLTARNIPLRRECCSFSNGEYVREGLAELQQWYSAVTEDVKYAGSAWDELLHVIQAIGFLVVDQKPKITLEEICHQLCPVLSLQQLYRIGTMYWDDKSGTHSLNTDVI